MNAFVRLYPRGWRARYGDELDDLAGRGHLGVGGTIDLIRGALDAHRHPELVEPASAGSAPAPITTPVSLERLKDLRMARGFGRAAWVGAGLWIAGWLVATNGPIVSDVDGEYRDGAAGLPFVLLAMVSLSVGLIGQLIRLPTEATGGRAGATVAIVTGPIWGLMPWVLPIGALTCGGLLVFALAARRASVWSGPMTAAFLARLAGGVTMVVWSLGAGQGDRMATYSPLLVAIVVFSALWVIVGATLQTLPPADATMEGNRSSDETVAAI